MSPSFAEGLAAFAKQQKDSMTAYSPGPNSPSVSHAEWLTKIQAIAASCVAKYAPTSPSYAEGLAESQATAASCAAEYAPTSPSCAEVQSAKGLNNPGVDKQNAAICGSPPGTQRRQQGDSVDEMYASLSYSPSLQVELAIKVVVGLKRLLDPEDGQRARNTTAAKLAGMLSMLRKWHPRAYSGTAHAASSLPELHAKTLAAATNYWQAQQPGQGDSRVTQQLLAAVPPTFAAVFPFLVDFEYRTASGVGDLLFTNGWGVYAAVEAKDVTVASSIDQATAAQPGGSGGALGANLNIDSLYGPGVEMLVGSHSWGPTMGLLPAKAGKPAKQQRSKRTVARGQARRYASDVLRMLPHAVVVLPFTAFLQLGAPVLGKRKRGSEGVVRQGGAAGMSDTELGVELECVSSPESSKAWRVRLGVQDFYAALQKEAGEV